MAGAGAAERFRDCDAEKAHLGEALPQLAVIRLLAVEHDTHRFRRAFFGEKFSRLVAELFLVVGEIEIHGGHSPGEEKNLHPPPERRGPQTPARAFSWLP